MRKRGFLSFGENGGGFSDLLHDAKRKNHKHPLIVLTSDYRRRRDCVKVTEGLV